MDGRFRFFHPISYRNQSPRRSRSRYRWIGPCFIFLLAFQLLAFQAQAQPSVKNQTSMFPGHAVSSRPTAPSRHHILWTDNCDPRTDVSHCSVGDLDILTPFYDVVDSLGAQLVYHVPTSLQELNQYDVVITNFC
ncbi:MAG: hypothetical protein AVDCRST_MAG93-6441, partial [uncultured Chloroflexia bacterium]